MSSTGNQKHCYIIVLVIFASILLTTIHVFWKKENSYITLLRPYLNQVKFRSDPKRVRICCLILTNPNDIFARARAVHETWGPHCNRHYFIIEDFKQNNFTSEQIQFIQKLPILSAGNISYGREHLTEKVNTALLFAHQHYLNDFDWFVKADDDTYIALDSLRSFLAKQNPAEPVSFGYNFKANHSDL